MKKILLVALLVLLAQSALATEIINESKQPGYLVVFSARGGAYSGSTLTLDQPVSTVLYFSDRPARVAGHMAMAEFLAFWSSAKANSFRNDPPNAVLSIVGDPEEARVVVELSEPHLENDQLSFTVRVIDGELPEQFGESAVFVDNICLPCI